jgi:hypothetical protein
LSNGAAALLSYLGLPTRLRITVLAPTRPLGRWAGESGRESATVSWKIQAAMLARRRSMIG